MSPSEFITLATEIVELTALQSGTWLGDGNALYCGRCRQC
jgi:hypothetical protein